MNKNLHEVDKLFRDALDNHNEPAPPGAWQGIDAELDKRQVNLFREKYYRLRRIMIGGIAAAVLVTAIFIAKKALDKPTLVSQGITKESEQQAASPIAKNQPTQAQKINSNKTDDKILTERKEQGATNGIAQTLTGQQADANEINASSVQGHGAVNHQNRSLKNEETRPNGPGNAIAQSSTYNTGRSGKKPAGKTAGSTAAGTEVLVADNLHEGTSAPGLTGTGNAQMNASSTQGQVEAEEKALYPYLASAIPYNKPDVFASLTSSAAPGIHMPKSNVRQNTSSRFSVTAFGSPNYSYTSLKDNDAVQSSARQKRIFENEERTSSSYTLGLLFGYALNKHFTIQSGIEYSKTTTDIAPKIIYARRDNWGHTRYEFNCSAGSAYMDPKTAPAPPSIGDSVKVGGSSLEVSYIGVPVLLNYRISMSKFSLEPTVGFTLNFLHTGESSTSFVTMPGTPKEREAVWGLKNTYVDAALGLGAAYQFNRKLSVVVKPQVRLALSSTNENMPVKTYQNYFSVESGLRFNL